MSANPNGQKFAKKVRRELLLIEAVRLARLPGGWTSLTRQGIAHASKCSPALVSQSLGSMAQVRKYVMASAIKFEYLDLISQGIAANYAACVKLSPVLKHRAISRLIDLGE